MIKLTIYLKDNGKGTMIIGKAERENPTKNEIAIEEGFMKSVERAAKEAQSKASTNFSQN